MDVDPIQIAQRLAAFLPAILIGITVHEFAHAWTARRFGDDTAYDLGRVSLNPLRHYDLVGTTLMIVTIAVGSPIPFGWAKPTPVHAPNLRQPRRDMLFVTLAGVGANLLTAAFLAGLYRLVARPLLVGDVGQIGDAAEGLLSMLPAAILLNLSLAVFNLLPIPPLDGGHALTWALSARASSAARGVESFLENFGFLLLLAVVFSPLGRWILEPPIFLLYRSLLG